jgi:hypothetical protein
MHESLKQNELRPYNYIGAPPSSFENPKPKMVSVSPYRANIELSEAADVPKRQEEKQYEDQSVSPLQQFKKRRPSPIKDDSVYLREKGDEFLHSFTQGVQ